MPTPNATHATAHPITIFIVLLMVLLGDYGIA